MIVTNDLQVVDFYPATVVDEIVQNVRTILSTSVFSVPLDRRFGINADFIDSPMYEEVETRLQSEIFTAITTFEPRVIVDSISIAYEPETGRLRPTVDIRIKEGVTS